MGSVGVSGAKVAAGLGAPPCLRCTNDTTPVAWLTLPGLTNVADAPWEERALTSWTSDRFSDPDPFAESVEEDQDSIEPLIALIEEQRDLLVAVATGGPAIDTVDREYTNRHREITRKLTQIGLENPFPWRDLWRWYGYYSANLSGYAARRAHIRELADTVIKELERRFEGRQLDDWGELEGSPSWASVEARLTEMKNELLSANSLDGLQDVGRRCREILIEAGLLVYRDEMLPDEHGPPSRNDSKARIGYYVDASLPGSSRAALRRLLRAAYDLTQAVTHSDSITFIDAFGAAQATVLLVRTLQRMDAASRPGV